VTPFPRLVITGIAILLLGACQADPAARTVEPTAAAATATDDATAEPAPTGAPASEPPRGSAGFTCDLPIVTEPTVAIANVTDVRVAEHPGHDRVVLEFAQGIPEATLARDEPPFFEDGSGFEVEIGGSSFLALVMRGGTKQTDDGTSSYDGPTDFERDYPMLRHLAEGGDFERQSTWYIGLNGEACVNLFTLDDPPRLVIDLEH